MEKQHDTLNTDRVSSVVFWVQASCNIIGSLQRRNPPEKGNIILRNVYTDLLYYKGSHDRRQKNPLRKSADFLKCRIL